MTLEEAREKLNKVNLELGEYFNAVQIHATWIHDTDQGTRSVHMGLGNWHARRSLSQEFIEADRHDDIARSIARHVNPPDESEGWKQ